MKRPTPHKRTGTTTSITISTMGLPTTDKTGKFAVPAPPTSRQKAGHEKLSISPSSAKAKLSVPNKDGSHSRRTSFVPAASGLGARTISPTDATRFARRLSQPPQATSHTIIVSDDEPLPTLTTSTFEKKFAAPMNAAKPLTLKAQTTALSRSPSPSPVSNRDSLLDSGIESSASGTISSGHPSPNTVFLETAKSSRRKSLVVVGGQNGVPPVPPIPKELSEKSVTPKVTNVKTSPKNANSPRGSPRPSPRYKSPPPPLPSQNIPKTPPISSLKARDRGLTLSTSIPSYGNTKSSQTPRETSRTTLAARQSLEPANLPPFKVSALATPTVQKVNALVAKNSLTPSTGKTSPAHRTVTTPQTAVAPRFPRGPRTPATPSLTPPIVHPSGVKTASAASSRRSVPSPASLVNAARKGPLLDRHTSNTTQSQVAKLPAHEEEKESPKSSMWRSVSRGTGKLVRRSSANDRRTGVSPRKKDEKADAAAMPAPTIIPKRNMFNLTKKSSTPAKDSGDRNTSSAAFLMTRQGSSNTTATPPPPRYSSPSSASNPSTDDESSGGNSREMEMIIRSASSKYRNKIERDLEELDAVRRRVVGMGDAGMKDPLTPAIAVKIWGHGMSTYEKGEIVDYPNVWFCSDASVSKAGRGESIMPSASKIPENATSIGVANNGFDDDIGNYVIVPGDHLAYRYEIFGVLGKGSFGQVCKCLDHKTGKVVAVKIIRNKQRFHAQALVEVNILQKLCQWVWFVYFETNDRMRMINIISFE